MKAMPACWPNFWLKWHLRLTYIIAPVCNGTVGDQCEMFCLAAGWISKFVTPTVHCRHVIAAEIGFFFLGIHAGRLLYDRCRA